MKKNKIILTALVLIVVMTMGVFSGCFNNGGTNTDPPPITYGVFTDNDFLKASGADIKNNFGTGDKVMLRGTNAGGYLVIERWMSAVEAQDHKSMTETMVERFGAQTTLQLWDNFRTQFWTDSDFKNCSDMGINVLRLPFTYMSVDPEFNNVPAIEGQKYNFELLDDFVERASQYGIYTILDLHGTYGSQNGQDHSGQVISNIQDVDFYTNEANIQKTIDLWQALAKHYKNNPAVAGYDILNEPGEKAQTISQIHWNVFDRIYDAIRLEDTNHIVIIESCWTGDDLPHPDEYEWKNCMYSFHHYTSTNDYDAHIQSFSERITEVNSQNFGIPIHMGEFNCYGNQQSWEDTLALLNNNGWHWTSWTYKLNRTLGGSSYSGWGIYYSNAFRADPSADSAEMLKAKWTDIRTDSPNTVMQTFSSNTTLFEIMATYCKQSNTN